MMTLTMLYAWHVMAAMATVGGVGVAAWLTERRMGPNEVITPSSKKIASEYGDTLLFTVIKI